MLRCFSPGRVFRPEARPRHGSDSQVEYSHASSTCSHSVRQNRKLNLCAGTAADASAMAFLMSVDVSQTAADQSCFVGRRPMDSCRELERSARPARSDQSFQLCSECVGERFKNVPSNTRLCSISGQVDGAVQGYHGFSSPRRASYRAGPL